MINSDCSYSARSITSEREDGSSWTWRIISRASLNDGITRSRVDFESPLGNSTYGKLIVVSDVPRLAIDSDVSMPYLVRANFESPRPHVNMHAGVVRIRYPSHRSLLNQLVISDEHIKELQILN